MPLSVTVRTPINIAIIKYWGKRDEELILPTNSSISVTLSSKFLGTTTTVSELQNSNESIFWLNGTKVSMTDRIKNCIHLAQEFASKIYQNVDVSKNIPSCDSHFLITSTNDVPTGSGLASSASGLSALAFALVKLYNLDSYYSLEELSTIARLGSGSACRSFFGGIVEWTKGEFSHGKDSIAKQIFSHNEWNDLEALILITNDSKKWVSSTSGMKTTQKTSTLFPTRLLLVDDKISSLKESIKEKDFNSFGKICMMDSNQFHSLCLDTYPPIFYLNDTSKYIIQLISFINEKFGSILIAYTFDAGPNPILFVLKKNILLVLSLFHQWCRFDFDNIKTEDENLINDLNSFISGNISSEYSFLTRSFSYLHEQISLKGFFKLNDSILSIIHSKIGDGPSVLNKEHNDPL